MDDLKACPFCGSKAELSVEVTAQGRPRNYEVKCTNYNCGAIISRKMPGRGPNKPKLRDPFEVYDKKYCKKKEAFNRWCREREKEAIEAWNRRASNEE